ncbi:MAG: hypothetical protein KAI22_11515 [Gammaproteobacteria bacterium]|nr:hypothetical protein [Gammaproteobacteria bacterium]
MDDGNATRGMDAVVAHVLRSIRPSVAKKKALYKQRLFGIFSKTICLMMRQIVLQIVLTIYLP